MSDKKESGGVRMGGDGFGKSWITEKALEVLAEYEGQITVRQLYYRLVSEGMINDLNHYKRVVSAMTEARWEGSVDFNSFIDRERTMFGETEAEATDFMDKIAKGKEQIKAWMSNYSLNRWENQPEYIEVWIEKKALQGVFEEPCSEYDVGLAPCKGYPSLTFLNEALGRFEDAIERGQKVTILYFGDHDPSGEDIPRSIADNIARMGCDIEVERIALNADQIRRFRLPSAPVKRTDTRSRGWSGGVVELDAVEPRRLKEMCEEAIKEHFSERLHRELMDREDREEEAYRTELKEFVNNLEE